VRSCPLDHGLRLGPGLPEAFPLPGVQLTDPGPVQIPGCSHTRMLEPSGAPVDGQAGGAAVDQGAQVAEYLLDAVAGYLP